MTAPSVFDLTGPLPRGTTVLEASAGTGKTYAIAGLVTRYVAETSRRLPELLVVTFTRAATAELRDRVRRRLVDAANHVEAVRAGADPASGDPVLAHLARGRDGVLAERQTRLQRALAEFDAATISTIHGVCQHVLWGLGLASDLDRDARLVAEQSELIEEVVDDLLVQTFHDRSDLPQIPRADLITIAWTVVGNPDTPLVPTAADDPAVQLRVDLARQIRDEVSRRRRGRRVLSYDDLLTRLDATLRDPVRGAAARDTLRARYPIALIDEFQDTDPVQWNILSAAFAGRRAHQTALVLIGDPKQAIYAFRGADVYAYLVAADRADRRQTLATNWRSDAALLDALHVVFDGAHFGDADIAYRQVASAQRDRGSRLVGAPDPAPVRLRIVGHHRHLAGTRGRLRTPAVREHIAEDVAADIVALLGSGARVRGDHGADRPLLPRDVAVLVRSNAEAAQVQRTLHDRGVPAIINGVGSVFATPAATDWRRLLEALERPSSPARVRALAVSAWIGWSGQEVADAGEAVWDDLHDAVHRWAELLRERGVAALERTVQLERDVHARLLRLPSGQRLVADLEHIGELLHAAAASEHLGPTTLSAWLHERLAETELEENDERMRRLETDDEAVQILTVHRSKGLEFGVVYCPFLWSTGGGPGIAPTFHDDDRQRLIDVGGKEGPDYAESRRRAEDEQRGEDLRLLYVALTRARHQVVAWYATAGFCEWSAMGRMLFNRGIDGTADTAGRAPVPNQDQAVAMVAALAARAGGGISVEVTPEQPAATAWAAGGVGGAELTIAAFERALDSTWRRTSYSGLTAATSAPRVGSEPDSDLIDDEAMSPGAGGALPGGATAAGARGGPGTGGGAPVGDGGAGDGGAGADGVTGVGTGHGADSDPHAALRDLPVPLAEVPGGTEFGSFVHAVLEHTDFAAADLDTALATAALEQRARFRLDDLDMATVLDGLRRMIETPLGRLVGEVRLRDVTPRDRLDEVDFELPLAGGDHPTSQVTVRDVARLMRRHLPSDDPLAGYAEQLPPYLLDRRLRGYLTGSIDLVLRHRAGGAPRFVVIDHKTNRLSRPDETLTAWHYRPAALVSGMHHGQYPLQALLYTAALHRYLRWRLPGYDPAVHLGGVLYLFVRGMLGADAPRVDGQPCGVFAWRVPVPLVEATSELLHGLVTA